jgi:hypothetical protein
MSLSARKCMFQSHICMVIVRRDNGGQMESFHRRLRTSLYRFYEWRISARAAYDIV